ncbi:hypothetical protein ABGB17_08030 [Sphaerisporangium sp. B11E5]|uniref:hypothetical protein n=1 Tax=Sphaerisporangium sp. B11E5 TaxID=3153563 RepID=UPI00325C741C
MRLTWKDAVTTICAAAVVAVYVCYLEGVALAFVSGVRWTAGAVLVLGTVGGCALGSAGDLTGRTATAATRAYNVVATALGVTALIAAVAALITANEVALAVLVYAVVALWLIATVRHALPAPGGRKGSGGRDLLTPMDGMRTTY